MSGKNISFYLLAAFVAGSLLLVYIQYNSSKNIHALGEGNQKYLEEYKINSNLRELEKDLVRVESNVSDYVSTGNLVFIHDIKLKTVKINNDLSTLQQVSDDSSCIELIDKLDTVVHAKLTFSNRILQHLKSNGKESAEALINTLEGKTLMDTVYSYVDKIKSARHDIIQKLNKTNIQNGARAETFNYILIALTLIAAAVLFWFIFNITQRLIASERKEKEATKLKESFLANMSHEIRTPLNAILGFTNLLQQQELAVQSKEYVTTIDRSGKNLLTILNDILDISKIEAGMLKIEAAPFSIRSIVRTTLDLFAAQIAEKNIVLKSEINSDVPDVLIGDSSRLTQIITNLIGNALKFTKQGSITLNIQALSKEKNNLQTAITITDTGIGIEKEKLTDIFNRFQQADNDITRMYGGTGLGLSIVKELIELQQGTIEVSSTPGMGTTFRLMIPYTIAANQDSLKTTTASKENQLIPFTKAINILAAEDNEVNQSLLKHLFNRWNVQYDIVSNGKLAIEMLQQKNYQLILMDIQMPVMDGYTATKEIRASLKNSIPIIAMTAHALSGEKEKCLLSGMNEYISKPIEATVLYNFIQSYAGKDDATETVLEKTNNGKSSYQYIRLDYMKELSNGNTAFEKEVTEEFIQSVPESIQSIETAWEKKDTKEISHLAHNLKSTIAIMGLTDQLSGYLDFLEYQQYSEEEFAKQFDRLKSICLSAVSEAVQFNNTLQ